MTRTPPVREVLAQADSLEVSSLWDHSVAGYRAHLLARAAPIGVTGARSREVLIGHVLAEIDEAARESADAQSDRTELGLIARVAEAKAGTSIRQIPARRYGG